MKSSDFVAVVSYVYLLVIVVAILVLSPGMYLWPFVCFLLDNDLTEEERNTGLFLGASHGLMCVLSFLVIFSFFTGQT